MSILLDVLLPLAATASFLLTGLILLLPSRFTTPPENKKCRVAVLVLGDIGRSPRMQYHAISLAKGGWCVDLIGYNESKPRPEVLSSDKIEIWPLPPSPKMFNSSSKLLFPLLAPLKVLFQVSALAYLLLYGINEAPGFILIQNPPSIPTMAIAHLVAFLRGSRLVIDWHNFGYTILGLKLGNSHPLVRISKLYEYYFGRGAHANFTVTDAMAKVLSAEFGIRTPTRALHDRPPIHFQPMSAGERQLFLSSYDLTSSHFDLSTSLARPKLVISSTSWTADEDFSILLGALSRYSTQARKTETGGAELPRVVAIITGKGPGQEYFRPLIDKLNADSENRHVHIKTAFLPAEDYPKLLACADLGVCLHTSSSGVDLPMKVVDMFGVGVPVAAVGFRAIGELVKGANGVVFDGEEELGRVLVRLLGGDGKELEALREGASAETSRRWDDEWDTIAKGIFEGELEKD